MTEELPSLCSGSFTDMCTESGSDPEPKLESESELDLDLDKDLFFLALTLAWLILGALVLAGA